MYTNIVKFFNTSKGFGFIRRQDDPNDVFVHISAGERGGLAASSENRTVSFELERGEKGKSAGTSLSLV